MAYLCLLSLFTLGIWELGFAEKESRMSQSENRMLQGFPAFSPAAVRSGEFMTEFDAFLSDAFPRRDGIVGLSESILGFFGGETEEDKDAARQAAMEAEGAVMEEPSDSGPGPATPAPTAAPVDREPVPEEVPEAEPITEVRAEDAAIWMIDFDGGIDVQEAYPIENLRALAQTLELYRDALPGDGQVHFINAPTSYMVRYLFYQRKAGWDSDLDEVLQSLVGERIYIYDETEILGDAVYDRPVYSFYGDHHWFPTGAWMTAQAMLERQGLVSTDYYEYLYRLASDFRGDPYTREQLEVIPVEAAARNIQVMVPLSPVESYIVTHLTEREPSAYMEDNRIEQYGIYLGGRRGPYRLFVTGYHTGRNALVIGDSFYHAFVPYLTPYYDNILAVDPRDDTYNHITIGPDISTYIEEYGIDDIYFVTCNYTSVNGYVFQDRLARYLYEDSAANG